MRFESDVTPSLQKRSFNSYTVKKIKTRDVVQLTTLAINANNATVCVGQNTNNC